MAMGKHTPEQNELYVTWDNLPQGPGHVFYDRLDGVLARHCFDVFVEGLCQKFYSPIGRPSMPPVAYFKALFIGYFEGIDSERGIAWRIADSLTLRRFLGYAITDSTHDHSTISRTRRLIDLETHQQVFQWVVTTLAMEGLIDGKTIGVDATTLEANAALRSIIRRDTGEAYQDFLTRLAQASGIETPTREDLAKIDRDRKGKGSNDDWTNPHDPDARITKMKNGSTHLAHKAEHAVDMKSGAVVAVTLQPANEGDTKTLEKTLDAARDNIEEAAKEPEAERNMHARRASELVADKGYHSNAVLEQLKQDGMRSYISEPKRGRRKWKGKETAQQAVYTNRRRVTGARGKALMRKRGELIERSFAHCYETGGMRRTWLRGHENILKRLLIHTSGFNISLILRSEVKAGTPRQLAQRIKEDIKSLLITMRAPLRALLAKTRHRPNFIYKPRTPSPTIYTPASGDRFTRFATGC